MDNVVSQMLVMLLVVLVGFVAQKFRLMGDSFDRQLSNLVINLTCPCLIVSSVMGDVFIISAAADYDLDFVPATKRKTRVLLLIVYILLAIPVALIGIVVLLIPTLAALGLAVGVIVLGSAALVAAFSLFQKLADLLILLGTAIIVLALGLLLLWLFVWFIGGAIGGLIRGLIELGRKWCFVEVPA